MKKRLLSILLVVCLLLGLLPTAALAEDTGSTAISYEVVAGTAGNKGEGPTNLLDGNIETKWCVSASNAYIIFKTSEAIQIGSYSITTADDNAEFTGRNPKSWVLYGSTATSNPGIDSETWETIHSVTDDDILEDKNYTTYNFTLNAQTEKAYQYFKLEISEIQSGTVLQMSEFALYSCTQHDFQTVTVPPTCTEDGYTYSQCSQCGLVKDRTPGEPATGHTLVAGDFVPGTEEEVGYTNYTCSVCGYTEKQFDTTNAMTLELTDSYGDGWNGAQLLIYRDGQLWETVAMVSSDESSQTVYLPYSDESGYSFYWQKGSWDSEVSLTVTLPNEETPVYTQGNFDDIEDGELLFQLNVGDYSLVYEAIEAIPADLSVYTVASVQALHSVVNAVNWELLPSKQSQIDQFAADIMAAIAKLALDPDATAPGCINMTTATADLYITSSGYRWGEEGQETPYTGAYRLGGTTGEVPYRVIVASGSPDITFFELHLTNNEYSPFTIQSGAAVSLTLRGNNELKSLTDDYAGLNVQAGAALEITEQSTGSLLAYSWYDGAGIGSNYEENSGSITISGGTVTAKSGDDGAGIGGSYQDSSTTVTITGGTVTVQSEYGAGIGCSYQDSGDVTVIISGGTVNAQSAYGAGIGNGDDCSGVATVIISGGTVNAQSAYGAGIGFGAFNFGDVTVTVTGGTINAFGNSETKVSAGISASSITIEGGTVNATGGTGKASYGILVDHWISPEDPLLLSIGDTLETDKDISAPLNLTISGGTINAIGGSATQVSYGIYIAESTETVSTFTITGSSLLAQASDEAAEHAALNFEPDLTGFASYRWRADAAASYTAGNFVWNDDPYDTYVEIIPGYVITFDPNGGTVATSTAMTGFGATLDSLPTPTRDDYTFAGWFTAASGGTAVTTETVFEGNTTIYAHWTANQYAITVESAANGSVTADRTTAAMGDTVTLTVSPDQGYKLETLTVTGASGAISVKELGNGKYSFPMPASQVTVKAVFAKAAQPVTNPFVDVKPGTFYYNAVLWAVNNGITRGTTATTFSPDEPCTRAQTVTFLWRAAGCPAPSGSQMPFTDVVKGSFYEKAVQWAVETGITKGTSATTFSPDLICNRAQIVTFLWRYQGKPAAGGTNPFTDVPANAYYTNAVLWAVENDITRGTTATTFSPDAPCTRAQNVTFLYRCMGN